MNKWKSKLIAVVTALCMALSVPVFAGSASVYVATQTMTDSTQFNRMDGALKKNSAAEKKALKFIKGTWYTQGGVPYHNKTVFSGKTVKLYAPGSKKVLYRYKIDKVTKTSYGYYYRIYLGKGCYGGWRLYLKDKSTLVIMGNGNPYSTSGYSGTDSLVRHK